MNVQQALKVAEVAPIAHEIEELLYADRPGSPYTVAVNACDTGAVQIVVTLGPEHPKADREMVILAVSAVARTFGVYDKCHHLMKGAAITFR